MQLTLIGMGGGEPSGITAEGRAQIEQAEALIGAKRLLSALPQPVAAEQYSLYRPDEILRVIQSCAKERICVLYSGDTGFYSGATELQRLLRAESIPYRVIPGASSVQLLSAALGEPWQSWKLVSAHGVACVPVAACSDETKTFFLTGGTWTPDAICGALAEAGFGEVSAAVGEQLGTANERVCRGTVAELAERRFDPLSVLLVDPLPPRSRRAPGFPDSAFCRGNVPMTKQEVRAAALAKLGVRSTDTVWDVGAGTGSVSVELALLADRGAVYAVECSQEACALIRENQKKFQAHSLRLIEGRAPDALKELPAPDAVFIGGTKGTMDAVVACALSKNAAARICVSAIALETLQTALQAFQAHGLEAEITQIAVSRTKAVGGLHLLMANNPIFLITVNCND